MITEIKSGGSYRLSALTLVIAMAITPVPAGSVWAGAPRKGVERQRPTLRLWPAVQRELDRKGLPKFMADGLAPTAEMLWRWRAESKVETGSKPLPLLNAQRVHNLILPLFEHAQKPTHYLFNGNGMYQAYLIAKALFKGTPVAKRIHFLPVSMALGEITAGQLDPYFELLGIAHTTADLAVVDTSYTGESLRLSCQALRHFLRTKGKSPRSIVQRVLPIGVQEVAGASPFVANVADYRKHMGALDPKQLVASYDGLESLFIKAGRWDAFWQSAWFDDGGSHYWEGKYSEFDHRGLPSAGTLTHAEHLSRRVEVAQRYLRTLSDTAAILDSVDTIKERVTQIAAQQTQSRGESGQSAKGKGAQSRAERWGIYRPYDASRGPFTLEQAKALTEHEGHLHGVLDGGAYTAFSHAVQELLKAVPAGKEKETLFVGVGLEASPISALLETLNPQFATYLPIDNAHQLRDVHAAHVIDLLAKFLPLQSLSKGTEIVLFQPGDGEGLAKVKAQIEAIKPGERKLSVRAVALHDQPRRVAKGVEAIDITRWPALRTGSGAVAKGVPPIGPHLVGEDRLPPDGEARPEYDGLKVLMGELIQSDQALDALLSQPLAKRSR